MIPRDVTELAGLVRDADAGLRIVGGGGWMSAGHTVHAAHEVRLSAFTGVRHYVPGDLTISVGAATTLAELDAATAANAQWCPLLSWGDDHATVGAVIATATSGPFATTLGRPRDLVLGLECVDGHGRIVRAGGRVVKNVAGFDLTRLMTGAWGTLGVVTEVHLRLRARPAVDETHVLSGAAAAAVRDFAQGPYAPLGCHQMKNGTEWLVRLGGNAAFVAASRTALQTLGTCSPAPVDAWRTVRASDAPDATATQWRWDALSRRLKALFDPRNVLNPGLLGESA